MLIAVVSKTTVKKIIPQKPFFSMIGFRKLKATKF